VKKRAPNQNADQHEHHPDAEPERDPEPTPDQVARIAAAFADLAMVPPAETDR
jgi:hypothetical protein